MDAGAAGRLYEPKGGKYYSSLLLMIMLDHLFLRQLAPFYCSSKEEGPRKRPEYEDRH